MSKIYQSYYVVDIPQATYHEEQMRLKKKEDAVLAGILIHGLMISWNYALLAIVNKADCWWKSSFCNHCSSVQEKIFLWIKKKVVIPPY